MDTYIYIWGSSHSFYWYYMAAAAAASGAFDFGSAVCLSCNSSTLLSRLTVFLSPCLPHT